MWMFDLLYPSEVSNETSHPLSGMQMTRENSLSKPSASLDYPKSMAVRLRRVCTILLALLAAASPVLSQPAVGSRDLCSQVPAIAQTLTKISGMKLLHPVPCAFITKEKINQFLKQRVHEDENPEDIRDEELVLKRFGFVPQDYNLADSTVDLLTEQAAAFYDYNRRSFSSPRPPLPTRKTWCSRMSSRTRLPIRVSTWPVTSARAAKATTAAPPAWP